MREKSQHLALIGFGEVGQILAADLQRSNFPDLHTWDRLFRVIDSGPSRAARLQKHLQKAASMAEAINGCSIVICAVTPGECLAAAREASAALAPQSFYVDLNSTAPETKQEAARIIEAAGGRFVEAVVMSPIGPKRAASPIWLGGPHAQHFLPLAHALGFSGSAVYSESLGQASAVKMCRSVVIKGMEALLAESLVAARYFGVEDAVLASLTDLLSADDWPKLAQYMMSRSIQHGLRRAEEMREVARTVADAGIEPWMSRGCIERQQWAAQHSSALRKQSLVEMLGSIRTQLEANASAGSHAAMLSGGGS